MSSLKEFQKMEKAVDDIKALVRETESFSDEDKNCIRAAYGKMDPQHAEEIFRSVLCGVMLNEKLPRSARMLSYMCMPEMVCVMGSHAATRGLIHISDMEGKEAEWPEFLRNEFRIMRDTRKKAWVVLLPREPKTLDELKTEVETLLPRVIAAVGVEEYAYVEADPHMPEKETEQDADADPEAARVLPLHLYHSMAANAGDGRTLHQQAEESVKKLQDGGRNVFPVTRDDALHTIAVSPACVNTCKTTSQGLEVINASIRYANKLSPYTAPRYAPVSALVMISFNEMVRIMQSKNGEMMSIMQMNKDNPCYDYNSRLIVAEQTFNIGRACARSMGGNFAMLEKWEQGKVSEESQGPAPDMLSVMEKVMDAANGSNA